jgi:hypothetical protein
MQTYLTTYSDAEYNEEKYQGFSLQGGSIQTSGSGYIDTEQTNIFKVLAAQGATNIASGLYTIYGSGTAASDDGGYYPIAQGGGQTLELVSTNRSTPFSIYTASERIFFSQGAVYNKPQGTSFVLENCYRGTSVERTIGISHFGSYTSIDGGGSSNVMTGNITAEDKGGEEYSDWRSDQNFENNSCGPFNPTGWNNQLFTVTAPVFSTLVASLTIDTISVINSSFNFLGTEFSYSFIGSTTSVETYDYSTTTTSTTDYIHHIGTGFGSNNSYFTRITQLDSDDNSISPYSAVFIVPSSETTFSTNAMSESSEYIFKSSRAKWIGKQLFTANSMPAISGTETSSTLLTETVFSYSYTNTIYTESTKTYTYTFNGDNGSWYTLTEDISGTTMATTGEVSIKVYSTTSDQGEPFISYAGGVPTYTISGYPTTFYTSTNRSGVLDGYATLYSAPNLNISTTQMQYLTTNTKTLALVLEKNYSITSSASGIVSDDEYDLISTTSNNSNVIVEQISTNYIEDRQFFRPIIVQPTFYNAGAFNQELFGMGNLYASQTNGSGRYATFSESPAVFQYLNRITYNASNFIPNYGIFSSIKQVQEELFKFPAIGIGSSFVENVPIYSNTSLSSEYTFTLRALWSQPINNKVDVSFYINYDTANTSAVQQWALRKDVSNYKYFRFPTGTAGSVTTYSIAKSFTDYPLNYIAKTKYFATPINVKSIIVPKNSARLNEYVTFDSSMIITDELNNVFFASSIPISYLAGDSSSSSITNFGNSMLSTSKTITIKSVISVVKYHESVYVPWAGRAQDFGMLNSTHFLNFTNYNGSTYIDV